MVTSEDGEKMTAQEYKKTVVEYIKAGLSVIRVNLDSKKPEETWAAFQQTIVSEQAIQGWTFKHNTGIAIICGKVSGNLEVIDIDQKYCAEGERPLLDRFKEELEKRSPNLFPKLVHETSQNGGHHLIYCCDVIGGNVKLATRSTTDKEKKEYITKRKILEPDKTAVPPQALSLFETRGEGGYFICHPSPAYTLKQGSFTNIPRITPEERAILFECASLFNSYVEPDQLVHGEHTKVKGDLKRPGDIFNERGTDIMRKVLEDNGWTRIFITKSGVEHYRRPGKDTDGISATFNHVPNLFYVFSSSASPFKPQTGYTPFAVYAFLKHKGNFDKASQELRKLGYVDTHHNRIENFLTDSYNFQRNVVLSRVEVQIKYANGTVSTWTPLTDEDINSIKRRLQNKAITTSVQYIRELIESDFTPKYNPFEEYFYKLPTWDGKDRIFDLVSTLVLKDPQWAPRASIYVTRWLVAALGCVLDEKIVNQTCLVLVGAQARSKSTWLLSLLPTPLESYKYIGMVRQDNKDTLTHLSECFFINLDEFSNLTKHDISELKSIITSESNRIRPAYGHYSEYLQRRASFVGTINKTNFLDDETGTRRFLTLWIDSVDIDKRRTINTEQLWAQVLHLYKSGFQYWFNAEESDDISSYNMMFSRTSAEEEALELYTRTREPIPNAASLLGPTVSLDKDGLKINWLTALQVAKGLEAISGIRADPRSINQYGRAMTKRGYHGKVTRGIKYYSVDIEGQYTLSQVAPNTQPIFRMGENEEEG